MGEELKMSVAKAGMVKHICNLSTLEVSSGGSELKTRLGYEVKPSLRVLPHKLSF